MVAVDPGASSCIQNMLVLVFISDTHEWGHIDVVKSAFWKLVLEIPIFRKSGILTVNVQRWKDKILPIFCLWASFISSSGSKDKNWMTLLWCTRTSPCPCRGSSAQDGCMSITRLLRSIQNHKRSKNSFQIWTRTWVEDAPEVDIFFSQMPPLTMNFHVKSQPEWT